LNCKILQNSVNPTRTGPDRCQLINYSELSEGNCTDPSTYRYFFVSALIFGVYNWSEEYSIWISPSSAGSRSSGPSSMFYGVFIAVKVDGIGKYGSADTSTVDIQTLGGFFWTCPKDMPFSLM